MTLFAIKYGMNINPAPESIGTIRPAFFPYMKNPSPAEPNSIESIRLVVSMAFDDIGDFARRCAVFPSRERQRPVCCFFWCHGHVLRPVLLG